MFVLHEGWGYNRLFIPFSRAEPHPRTNLFESQKTENVPKVIYQLFGYVFAFVWATFSTNSPLSLFLGLLGWNLGVGFPVTSVTLIEVMLGPRKR